MIEYKPRLPRLGWIVTGEKTASGPKALGYFRFRPARGFEGLGLEEAFYAAFGQKPRQLPVIFPAGFTHMTFRREEWGSGPSGPYLKHACDGQHVLIRYERGVGQVLHPVDAEGNPVPCPYLNLPENERRCQPRLRLNFILPGLAWQGMVTLSISSRISISRITASYLAYQTLHNPAEEGARAMLIMREEHITVNGNRYRFYPVDLVFHVPPATEEDMGGDDGNGSANNGPEALQMEDNVPIPEGPQEAMSDDDLFNILAPAVT